MEPFAVPMIGSGVMQICDVFLALGEETFGDLLRHVSMGRLRTYQLFDQIKARTHLVKLNNEHLRKAAPRLWARLKEHDQDLATDLSQAVLVSSLDLIIEALNLLGVPHQDGFFAKDADIKGHFTEGWREQVYDALKSKYPHSVLVFYINHLGVEIGVAEELFAPASA